MEFRLARADCIRYKLLLCAACARSNLYRVQPIGLVQSIGLVSSGMLHSYQFHSIGRKSICEL